MIRSRQRYCVFLCWGEGQKFYISNVVSFSAYQIWNFVMLFCFVIGDISFDHMVKNESHAGFGSRMNSIEGLFYSSK